jgi:hypothetical protein
MVGGIVGATLGDSIGSAFPQDALTCLVASLDGLDKEQ